MEVVDIGDIELVSVVKHDDKVDIEKVIADTERQ